MIKVTVDWYDALKGLGEGKTSDGVHVFLNGNFIDSKGHFSVLAEGETVFCELKKNDHNTFYASRIERLISERKEFNKTSFLEPQKLPRDTDSSL